MVGRNIVKHSLRLNLQEEEQRRIQEVLENLNKEIHRSENLFIIRALDFYIRSFEEESFSHPQRETVPYVTVEDLERFRQEQELWMKEELIRLLGASLAGGIGTLPEQGVGEARKGESEEAEESEQDKPWIEELANRWG